MRVQGLAEHITKLIQEDDHPEIVNVEVRGKDQSASVLSTVKFANGATAAVQVLRVRGADVSGPEYTVPEKAW